MLGASYFRGWPASQLVLMIRKDLHFATEQHRSSVEAIFSERNSVGAEVLRLSQSEGRDAAGIL